MGVFRMNKPVWRMNSGLGVPSDSHTSLEVLFDNGAIRHMRMSPELYHWGLDMPECYIAAYKTNRTRKAKYESIPCPFCVGLSALILRVNGDHVNYCPHCNGKGYRLDRVE